MSKIKIGDLDSGLVNSLSLNQAFFDKVHVSADLNINNLVNILVLLMKQSNKFHIFANTLLFSTVNQT